MVHDPSGGRDPQVGNHRLMRWINDKKIHKKYKNYRRTWKLHWKRHQNNQQKFNLQSNLTVAEAGCRPDISWYKVWRGSLIGRELAKRIMTLACVRASVLLASSRAWPHKLDFIAHSRASCAKGAQILDGFKNRVNYVSIACCWKIHTHCIC